MQQSAAGSRTMLRFFGVLGLIATLAPAAVLYLLA